MANYHLFLVAFKYSSSNDLFDRNSTTQMGFNNPHNIKFKLGRHANHYTKDNFSETINICLFRLNVVVLVPIHCAQYITRRSLLQQWLWVYHK